MILLSCFVSSHNTNECPYSLIHCFCCCLLCNVPTPSCRTNINVKPPSILCVACLSLSPPCIDLQHPPITAASMDPPDAPATFLGASPFTNYLRELLSQEIANRALLMIASQNDCLTSTIALTIASCLDDPIADDCFDDNCLIILPIGSAPIALAEWSQNNRLASSIALSILLPVIASLQNDRFIVLPLGSAPIALAALSPSNEGLAADCMALLLPLPPLLPPAAAIAADLLPQYDQAAPGCHLIVLF
jgi:hypothetical protein